MRRLGGVGYILTCTEINFHPIVKPFEMGAYWSVMKPPIFLFDHRMFATWDFSNFSKKFDKNWLLVPQNQPKKFSKNFQSMDWVEKRLDRSFFNLGHRFGIYLCIGKFFVGVLNWWKTLSMNFSLYI